jgi:hypothetical protein
LANQKEKGIDDKDVHENTGESTDHWIPSFFNDIDKIEEGEYTWDGEKFVKK